MDDLDVMLQGQDQAQASQAQKEGQGDDSTQGQPIEQQTPEEIEFNNLSGSAQERIKKLVQDKRDLSQRLTNLERQGGFVPPAPGSTYRTPEVEDAVRKLSDVGLATKDEVTKTVDERLNVLRWEQEQARLEGKYDGSNGPQYVREEVEDFIQSHPQYRGYAAEDVFRDKMFRDDFIDLELSKRGSKTGRSSTLKPTSRAASTEPSLTPEYIADRTDLKKYPDALEWQEEHRHEIDKVLSQMS